MNIIRKYYVLLDEKDEMIVTDCRLPIYWDRQTAITDAQLFGAKSIKKIRKEDIDTVLFASLTMYQKQTAKKLSHE